MSASKRSKRPTGSVSSVTPVTSTGPSNVAVADRAWVMDTVQAAPWIVSQSPLQPAKLEPASGSR